MYCLSNKVMLLVLFSFFLLANTGKSKDGEKPAWAKKDIRDYSEADLERLLDQWDVSDAINLADLTEGLIFDCLTGRRGATS